MSDESTPAKSSGWLDRIAQIFTTDPENLDDLKKHIESAAERGLLDTEALRMVEGVLSVSESTACDIMVPRNQMVVLESNWSFEKILTTILSTGYSRFPVVGESKDDVKGILISKDLLTIFRAESPDIMPLLRPVQFVTEGRRISALLKDFRAERYHQAVVVDEYGSVAGLVTIEDILEEIVGEIDDEHDEQEEHQIKNIGGNRYLVDALVPLEDFNAFFHIQLDEERADTLGGYLMLELGALPSRNTSFTREHLQFKILQVDTKRIQWLEVSMMPTEAA